MSAPGRFKLERHHRAARRGPASMVQDGWDLTDTLTGAKQHFSIKADAQSRMAQIIAREEEIKARADEVAGWDTDLEFRHRTVNIEMYLYGADGAKLVWSDGRLAALLGRAYGPMWVVDWLREMGLAQIPRRS